MKKIILTALILMGTSAFFPQTSNAQDQIFVPLGTDFDNRAARLAKFARQQSLSTPNTIPAGEVQVSIVHPDFLEKEQFALLFQRASTETGCHQYSPIEYEAKFIENYYMDIDLKHFRSSLKPTQNPEYDCNQTYKVATGMVVLNADDLAKKKIREIRFSNGQSRDAYTVNVLDNGVRLTPKSMLAFKAVNLQGPDRTYIQYNFPDNSLLKLQVPMARQGDDIAQAVRTLAFQSTLEPVFDREGLDTSGANNVFYFTDPNATTLDQLGKDGYMEIGTITIKRPYDGPNGRVAKPTDLKVFATRQDVTL